MEGVLGVLASHGDAVSVVVASKAGLKVEAVRAGVETALAACKGAPKLSLDVQGVKAASGINEQPCGLGETLRGAANRANAAHAAHAASIGAPAPHLVVAIENGIVQEGEEWFDFAWVVARAYDNKHAAVGEAKAQSAWTPVPARFVETAKAHKAADGEGAGAGFEVRTAGQEVAQELGGNHQDPHSELTGGAVTRQQMLVQAVAVAVGSLLAAHRTRLFPSA